MQYDWEIAEKKGKQMDSSFFLKKLLYWSILEEAVVCKFCFLLYYPKKRNIMQFFKFGVCPSYRHFAGAEERSAPPQLGVYQLLHLLFSEPSLLDLIEHFFLGSTDVQLDARLVEGEEKQHHQYRG